MMSKSIIVLDYTLKIYFWTPFLQDGALLVISLVWCPSVHVSLNILGTAHWFPMKFCMKLPVSKEKLDKTEIWKKIVAPNLNRGIKGDWM